ncbi:hypothetical protein DFH11DRAFT_1557531 [Phellopilus nigrolimitatus]|nr:hypothetical protein DFH11DRAFT_1557531 [Phellopilus nigrolimitatus]
MAEIHWRTELNNYLQSIGKRIEWDVKEEGLQHRPTWKATVEYDGTPTGNGVSLVKGEAMDLAAKEALSVLAPDRYNVLNGGN